MIKYILLILVLSISNRVSAQSLTIVNHTDCSLGYGVKASVGKPCSTKYSPIKDSKGYSIAPNQTVVWTNPQKIEWAETMNMPIYWYSFIAGTAKSENIYVGPCHGNNQRYTTANIKVPECANNIYYSWQQDSLGNVFISIEYGY